MKVNFAFNLEIKVPESGGRLERHRIHVAWSPVWSFHSQWWFVLPCHLLVLVHCVFWSPQSTQPSTRNILEHFMLPSADKFYGDADFIFQQDFSTLPEVPKASSMTMVLLCLIGQQTRLTWTPQRIYGALSRGRWETPDPTTQMTWPLSKTTWASITPEQCHRLIASMPRHIDAVIHAKGGPTKYWVHRNEHTFQKPAISV